MLRVLTVASECGSGGSIIAKMVARKLGWHLLDRDLIEAVAQTAHVDTDTVGRYDEHVDSWWHRFNRGGLQAAAIHAGVPPADAQLFDAEAVAALTRQAISEAADTGSCVIVGRGAQCVLQNRSDVLHVFVYGPWSERASRVRGRQRSVCDVGELIRRKDQERASYIRTYYGCDWKDPHLYQMIISSHIGIENVAWLIVEAVQRGTAA
jgi:cytidylate kinase